MPFKSAKQERFMWAEHPEIARRWENEKMATDRSFGSMLNQLPGQKPQREPGLRGMNFRSLSFGALSKRAKPNASLNVWAKMLKKGEE